jgi:hypothetical protein
VRAFNAKKATLSTSPSDSIEVLAAEADERLRRAGA